MGHVFDTGPGRMLGTGAALHIPGIQVAKVPSLAMPPARSLKASLKQWLGYSLCLGLNMGIHIYIVGDTWEGTIEQV